MKQSQSQMDWKVVERHLQKSQEREELRRFAKNDREEIRRKLAMEDDDVGDGISENDPFLLIIRCALTLRCSELLDL